MSKREAVVIAAARTPIGKVYRGASNNAHALQLAGHAIREAIDGVSASALMEAELAARRGTSSSPCVSAEAWVLRACSRSPDDGR
jgi:acetyl-CoA acetyltransferase